MKKIFSMTLAIIVLLMSTTISSAESIRSLGNTVNENQEELIKNFTELGIDQETQRKLIRKLENGEMIDSMKPENFENVVNLESMDLDESKIIIYPDGSRSEIGLETIEEPDQDNEYGILSFKDKNPGTYLVKVYWNTGVINAVYYTEIVIRSGSNNDYIKSVTDGSASGFVSVKTEATTIPIQYENSTNYAYSQYRITYEALGMSGTLTLHLLVGNNGYESGTGGASYVK